MDYKEKYEQALERARQFSEKPYLEDSAGIVEYIFPELKESEDEKRRKAIIDFFSEPGRKEYILNGFTVDDIITWLEKQGTPVKLSEEEQNRFAKGVLTSCALSFIDYLDAHKYKGKMCVSNGECEDIENAFHNDMWDRLHRYYCKYIEKQSEKKESYIDMSLVDAVRFCVADNLAHKSTDDNGNTISFGVYIDNTIAKKLTNELFDIFQKSVEWSEEGKKKLNNILNVLIDYKELEPEYYWLKSLRLQSTWKPSDLQIEALESATENCAYSEYEDCLRELIGQLKNLKG